MLALVAAATCVGAVELPSADQLRALKIQRGTETVALGSLVETPAPTIVSLWTSYCVACRAETSTLLDARKRWGAKVVVVLSDVDDPAVAARFRRQTGTPFEPLPIAPAQEDAAEALAPEGFPTNFLLTGDRVARIDRLLKATDVATFFHDR